MNVNGNQWVCAVVDIRRSVIEYYDSLGGCYESYVTAIRRWIWCEMHIKYGIPLHTEWTTCVAGSGGGPKVARHRYQRQTQLHSDKQAVFEGMMWLWALPSSRVIRVCIAVYKAIACNYK
jgi:hypothetical protein